MSMTNGGTGHYRIGGGELIRRRWEEAKRSAALIGADYLILDIPNNGLEPHLYLRWRLIEIIREFKADIVITHRPNDYHPDHRYTSLLVQDTSTAINNPNVCPLTPPLKRNPLYLYMMDNFLRPYPFQPDLVFDIEPVIEKKMEMLHQHTSQVYEWLPWEQGRLKEVPLDVKARKKWLKKWFHERERSILIERLRPALIKKYGDLRGKQIKYAEAFEFSEYGSSYYRDKIKRFFKF